MLRRSWAVAAIVAAAAGFGVAENVSASGTRAPEPPPPGTFIPSSQSQHQADPTLLEGAVGQYAEKAGVSTEHARQALEQQALGAGLEEALRDKLGTAFGGLEFDVEHARWKVILSPSGSEAAAVAVLKRQGVQSATFGRTRWSAVEREAAQRAVYARMRREASLGIIRITSTPQEGVVIRTARHASADIATKAQSVARGLGEIVSSTESTLPTPEPVACGPLYCDPPLVAGVQYGRWTANSHCTTGFAMRAAGSGARFNLTAGHCTHIPSWPSPGQTVGSCNAAMTWCPAMGHDSGGYYSAGGDGGLMEITNPQWPNYPAFRVYGWANPTYAVSGTQQAAVNQFLCKTGYASQTTCGFVYSVTEQGPAGGNSFIGVDTCALPGDSGGPLFDPATGMAVGITSGSWAQAGCTGTLKSVYEPVLRAGLVFGVYTATP